MDRQRAEARAAWAGSGEAAAAADLVRAARATGRHRVPRLRRPRRAEGQVLALIVGRRARSTRPPAGADGPGGRNQTPFYAECGGQVGDTGADRRADGDGVRVIDTQKQAGDLYVHVGTVVEGTLKVGDARRSCAVDAEPPRRDPRQPLRHPPAARGAAPRAGRRTSPRRAQLVDADRLRFDFSHARPLTPDELAPSRPRSTP